MPFPPSIIFEFICLLAAAWWLLRARTGWWQWFVPFILYTLVTEITSVWMNSRQLPVYGLYNVYTYIKFTFAVVIFIHLMPSFSRTWQWMVVVIFHIVLIIELNQTNFSTYAAKTNIVCGIWIITLCCIYFFTLMNEKNYVVISRHAPFWIMAGLLLFYIGTTTCNIFFKQLKYINEQYGIPLRFIIFNTLSLILYAAWTYAFLCKFRQTISSSASSP